MSFDKYISRTQETEIAPSVRSDVEELFHGAPPPFIVLGIGIPGSGKTTELRKLADQFGLDRICADEIRAEITGSEADQSLNNQVWAELLKRVEVTLALGKSGIIDATHAEAWRRRDMISIYRSFGACAIIGIFFNVSLEEAKQRNLSRSRVVPEFVLEHMHSALEQDPPHEDEGFDKVITL